MCRVEMKGNGDVLLWMRHGRNNETLHTVSCSYGFCCLSVVSSKGNYFHLCQIVTLVVQFSACWMPQNDF